MLFFTAVQIILRHVFLISVGESVSSTAPLTCGVPQGSILGPLIFSLYMLLLGSILRKHGILFDLYADDSRIDVPLNAIVKVGCVVFCAVGYEETQWKFV